MVSSCLLQLPPELQLAVIDCIPKHSDLSSLCLTCKAMRNLTMPRLYNTITIGLLNCKYPPLDFIYMPAHSGRKHVRGLFFEPFTGALENEADALKVLKLTLEILPCNTLTWLFLPPGVSIDIDFLMLLSARQHKLEEVFVGNIATPLKNALALPSCPPDWLNTLRDLAIQLTDKDVDNLQVYGEVISRARQLHDLSIRLDGMRESPDFDKLQDTAQSSGSLTQALFGHLTPFGSKPPLLLQCLYLGDVSMTYSSPTFMRIIDFHGLRTLYIFHCRGSGILLQHLANAFEEKGSALELFTFCSRDLLPTGEMAGLLKSWTRLRSWKIWSRAASGNDINFEVLSGHFASLRTLACFLYQISEPDWILLDAGAKNIAVLAASAHELRELCLIFVERVSVLTTSSRKQPVTCPAGLEALFGLRNLQLLLDQTWPTAPKGLFRPAADDGDSKEIEQLCKTRYMTLLDIYASRLMRRIADIRAANGLPRLSMLCYGGFANVQDGDDRWMKMEPCCYLPAMQTDEYGRSELRAIRKTKQEVKYITGDRNLFHNL